MEFTHIGAHCSLPDCKQLDFLPFDCESCHKRFCGDHRLAADHKCSKEFQQTKQATTLNCVLCEQVLVVKPDQDPNQVVETHISRGDCTKQQPKTINKHKCTKCGKFGMTEIICRDCGNNYCLSHRFNKDHACKMNLRRPSNMIGPFRVPISVKS